MSGFEALLNKVKEAQLISEEEASTMLTDFNAAEQDKIDQAVAAAEGSAFKDGYNQGFTNAKQQAEADTKKALDELLAKCDEEATVKLQTVIDSINNSHAEKLQEVYDMLTQAKADAVDAAVAAKDQEDSAALAELMESVKEQHKKEISLIKESIDKDHTNKLNHLVANFKKNYVPASELKKMDEDHANKLNQILEAKDSYDANKLVLACEAVKNAAKNKILATESFMNKKMKAKSNLLEKKIASLENEKEQKLDTIAESVEKYLNYALQTAIPTKDLISEAKYNASQKAIEKIISILKINNVIQESKDGIFKDYEDQIKTAKEETNKVMLENVELKSKLNKNEAKYLLESKLKNCTPAEAEYLRRYFSNANSAKIIEEQIEGARNEYKKMNDERRSNLKKKIENINISSVKGNVVSESVNTPKEESLNKKTAVNPQKPVATEDQKSVYNIYADFLKNNH